MAGSVENHERVGRERRTRGRYRSGEARRADLLLAVQHDFEIERERLRLRREHVERRQQHQDRRFVVGRGPREHAELRIQRPCLQGVRRYVLPLAGVIAAPDHGHEGIGLRPLRRDHRLPVVVVVEENRREARSRRELGEHDRPVGRIRHQAHVEAAPLERARHEIRVALDVGRLSGDIRNAQRVEVLGEVLLRGALDLLAQRTGCGVADRGEQRQREEHVREALRRHPLYLVNKVPHDAAFEGLREDGARPRAPPKRPVYD